MTEVSIAWRCDGCHHQAVTLTRDLGEPVGTHLPHGWQISYGKRLATRLLCHDCWSGERRARAV